MTVSLQRILELLRGTRTQKGAGKPAVHSEAQGYAFGSTGETVYDDRPLRFRKLTVSEPADAIPSEEAIAAGFKIRISKKQRGRQEAGSLVENKYSRRGYELPILRKEAELHTFLAYDEGQIVGTVGLRMDGRRGLAADELYPNEISALRAQGFRLCEFTRLAVDKRAASKPVLAGMFHTAYLYASVIRGATHAVIEVNPRHARFYGRALRFRAIGEERLNKRVNAPAVLLFVPFADIADGLARYAGRLEESREGGPLFPYFFPASEELGVLQRLRDLVSGSDR